MRRGNARLTATLGAASADLLAYLQRRVGLDDAREILGETMVVAWRRVGARRSRAHGRYAKAEESLRAVLGVPAAG